MLEILPAFAAIRDRYQISLACYIAVDPATADYYKVALMCLRRVVSSHSTGCKHRSHYFLYYHLHLM